MKKFVAFSKDETPEQSHKKMLGKTMNWGMNSNAGDNTKGINITKRQLNLQGNQLFSEIIKWAEKNGIKNVHLRLKEKVSETSYQKKRKSWKKKTKFYFYPDNYSKFPKNGITKMSLVEIKKQEIIKELLTASWKCHIYSNSLPIRTYSFELVMRNPENEAKESIFLR